MGTSCHSMWCQKWSLGATFCFCAGSVSLRGQVHCTPCLGELLPYFRFPVFM